MKTTEELLQPRILVTGLYPYCPFNVGDILIQANPKHAPALWKAQDSKDNTALVSHPEKYEHLFKPLQWWQERLILDMPPYLKEKDRYPDELVKVFKVHDYTNTNSNYVRVYWPGNNNSGSHSLYELLPATEAEYLAYKQAIERLNTIAACS